MKTKKELSEMTREELGQELMRMPELETSPYPKVDECLEEFMQWKTKEHQEQEEHEQEIHKNMHNINTFQCTIHNELYLRGTDESGKDFTICFSAFEFLEWIDSDQIKWIKKQVKRHVDTK